MLILRYIQLQIMHYINNSPVDGEIGSKQFAMSETPIMVLNNCWKWALFWSETFSLQSEMFIAHYNKKKNVFLFDKMNLINDLHIFSWKQHVVLPETVQESPSSP